MIYGKGKRKMTKAPVTRRDAVEKIAEMEQHCEIMLNYIHWIAALIYYQEPLKKQDEWLKDIMDNGIWESPTD
tara:strand:- start:268 stop:486 length:219 start_codon:yes stop_codon:yes gene_type:complete